MGCLKLAGAALGALTPGCPKRVGCLNVADKPATGRNIIGWQAAGVGDIMQIRGTEMSYEAVLTQVRAVPEACLDEISSYIDYVVYRYEKQERAASKPQGKLSKYFGLMDLGDGLAIQKEMRDEWN